MSAIEASLRLEIAQYQQQLAKATASVVKFKEDAKRNSAGMGQAIMGKPEDWMPRAANMAGFRASMAQEGQAGGSLLGAGMNAGLLRAGGLVGLGLAAGKMIMSSTQAAMRDEVLTVRMNVLVGNKEAAAKFKQDLKTLGTQTPLEFPELADAGQKLVAFGEDAKDVPATLRRIGDVATGVGAPIGEIAELYGKARVQGTLFAEDINQLTGRGIPVIQEFANTLGVSQDQIKKLASEGRITFPMLEQAFKNLISNGGKFSGMMDQISKTTEGKWSNFKDELSGVSTELGKPLKSLWGGVLDQGIAKVSLLRDVLDGIRGDSSRKQAAQGASDAKLFAGYNEKKAARESAEAEGKIKAEFQRKLQEAEAAKNREKAALAATAREQELKHLVTLRGQLSELSVAMLPNEQRLQALKDRMSQIFVSAQLGSGKGMTPSTEGLMQLAGSQKKEGNLKGEAATIGRLQEVLKLEKEIQGIQEAISQDAEKNAAEKLRAESAREVLDLETKIAQAKAAAQGQDNEKVRAFQDQLNALQLSEQIQSQLNISQEKAVQLAREKVGAERAAAAAAKAAAQGDVRRDAGQELAILRAQASGKEELAKQMQRQIDIEREAKRLTEDAGLGEEDALRVAREKARLKEQIANQEKPESGNSRYDADGRREDGRKKIDARIDRDKALSESGMFGGPSKADQARARVEQQKAKFQDPMYGPTAASAANPLAAKAQGNAQRETPQSGTNPQQQAGQQVIALITQILEAVK